MSFLLHDFATACVPWISLLVSFGSMCFFHPPSGESLIPSFVPLTKNGQPFYPKLDPKSDQAVCLKEYTKSAYEYVNRALWNYPKIHGEGCEVDLSKLELAE